ncbi:MAG: hypothetical protein ACI8TP_000364 [Acidimicrobiales bacterium]|jgi:hypothetical protein
MRDLIRGFRDLIRGLRNFRQDPSAQAVLGVAVIVIVGVGIFIALVTQIAHHLVAARSPDND